MLGAFYTNPDTPACKKHLSEAQHGSMTGSMQNTAETTKNTFMYRPACRIIHTGGRSTLSPRTALSNKGSCDFCKTQVFCREVQKECQPAHRLSPQLTELSVVTAADFVCMLIPQQKKSLAMPQRRQLPRHPSAGFSSICVVAGCSLVECPADGVRSEQHGQHAVSESSSQSYMYVEMPLRQHR